MQPPTPNSIRLAFAFLFVLGTTLLYFDTLGLWQTSAPFVPNTFSPNRTRAPAPASANIKFTICVGATSAHFSDLREFVGAVHWWEPGRPIAAYVFDFNQDQFNEASLFEHTSVFSYTGGMPHRGELDLLCNRTYPYHYTADVSMQVKSRMCELDRDIRLKKQPMIIEGGNFPPECASNGASCYRWDRFFTPTKIWDVRESTCALQLRYAPQVLSPPARPVSHPAHKPLWCLCIATYAKAGHPIEDQALLSVTLPSLIETITPSLDNYSFALYLGTQVDEVWDNPTLRSDILSRVHAMTDPVGMEVRVHRYSLNPSLFDIAYKYNALIAQAYVDGCDYMYQYSDDAFFITADWPRTFAKRMEQNGGFGTIGPRDLLNSQTMTLGAAGRKHLEIQEHFFWPARMKNWFSDNYIQDVYGHEYSVWMQEVQIRNSQKFGVRYNGCYHDRLVREEEVRSQWRAIKWAQANRPDLVQPMTRVLENTMRVLKNFPRFSNQLADPAGCPVAQTYEEIEQLELPPYIMEEVL